MTTVNHAFSKKPIMMRPYEFTYVISYFPDVETSSDYNREGFRHVIEKCRKNPDIEIKLAEEFDDVCLLCEKLYKKTGGSIWGKEHSCPSAENQEIRDEVATINEKLMAILGLEMDAMLSFRRLAFLFKEKFPDPTAIGQGREEDVEQYQAGLDYVMRLLSGN
jgi:hypothetical protein